MYIYICVSVYKRVCEYLLICVTNTHTLFLSNAHMNIYVCLCVCVCVREREGGDREGERELFYTC